MSRLDELLRQVRAEPPDSLPTERMWAAIEARLAREALGSQETVTAEAGSSLGSVAPSKNIVGALLALGGGLLGGWLSSSPSPEPAGYATPVPVLTATDGPIEPEPGLASAVEALAAAPLVSSRAPRAPEEAVIDVPQDATLAQGPASKPPKKARRSSRSVMQADPEVRDSAPEVAEPARDNDIRAELLLVEEMQGALRRGDMAMVLRKADQHAREYGGTGRLIQERIVHTVEALCALGRVDEAKAAVRELLSHWPESTHARRARASCAGPR